MISETTFSLTSPYIRGISIGASLFFLSISILLGSQIYYHQTFYPGITIQGKSVAGLTKDQVRQMLAQELETPTTIITLTADSHQISSSSAELGLHYNYPVIIEEAFAIGHQGSLWQKTKNLIQTIVKGQHFTSQLVFDASALEEFVQELKNKVDQEGENPSASLGYSNAANSLVINPGKYGRELQKTATYQKIIEQTANTDLLLEAEVASTSSELTSEQIDLARERATHLIGASAKIRADNITIGLNDQELIKTLAFPEGYNPNILADFVKDWEEKVNRPPQDAILEYDSQTLEVFRFEPDRKGLTLKTEEAIESFKQLLSSIETDSANENQTQTYEQTLPVSETDPQTPLGQTNNLGIKELIGFGESNYDHSIPSRIHNVALTTDKIKNTIVPPGEEFSFNKTLGEVSARTGFRPAYVIKGNRTVLGDGGGVCQVSTTLFRSVLNAGLDVTKRLQHSYRVSYYEQGFKPGIDATVYSGDIDFRFINDTDHHILISGHTDSENLYMAIEIYGTSDGRSAELTEHITWDARAPLPTEYYDDPTLPPGAVKQIDWSASGIKASFKNTVKDKDGNIIHEDEYYSNYRPWAAKYLRGI